MISVEKSDSHTLVDIGFELLLNYIVFRNRFKNNYRLFQKNEKKIILYRLIHFPPCLIVYNPQGIFHLECCIELLIVLLSDHKIKWRYR